MLTGMSGMPRPLIGRLVLLALCGFLSTSCSRAECAGPEQDILLDRYYAYGADVADFNCFGPPADCSTLCRTLAISASQVVKTPTIASVAVCERVSAPEGWSDAGFEGWEDAGYVAVPARDGGVDSTLVLHLVVRVRPFCGT
jgi:hypothetical protein